MSQVNVTPLVRKLAADHRVNLNAVTGTGAGGRITAADVRRTITELAPFVEDLAGRYGYQSPFADGTRGVRSGNARELGAVAPMPHLSITRPSYWTRPFQAKDVTLDVFGLNPLLEDLVQANPVALRNALERMPSAPTLFATGDMPLFTTAGFDPAILARLPYVARPAAASADPSAAAEIFQTYSTPTLESWDAALFTFCNDHVLNNYEARFRAWVGALPNDLDQ